MRNLIISILFVVTITSCGNNSEAVIINNLPAKQNAVLGNDGWVELKDTIHLDIRCVDANQLGAGVVFNSENDYLNLFSSSTISKGMNDSMTHWGDCNQYLKTNIDFANFTILGLSATCHNIYSDSQLFINDKNKEYLFISNLRQHPFDYTTKLYTKWLCIPKCKNGYKISFDTIQYRLP